MAETASARSISSPRKTKPGAGVPPTTTSGSSVFPPSYEPVSETSFSYVASCAAAGATAASAAQKAKRESPMPGTD